MILGLFPGLDSIGGIQTAGRQTVTALASIARKHAWESIFLSLNDLPGEHEIAVCGSAARFTGFARRKASFVCAALRAGLRRPVIIFAAHPHLGPVCSAVRALSPASKTIIGAHGVEVWKKLGALRALALRRADIVLAPSSHTEGILKEVQNVCAANVRRLPWPLAPDFLRLAQSADGSAAPLVTAGKIIFSVARWETVNRYKGGDLLIVALTHLRKEWNDVQLVLAGPGDDLPRLEQLAAESGVRDAVHFLKGVSREALAALYSRADVFALPSTGEGFGLVFLEAMSFGKPVIGAAAGGVPDIIEDGQTGFLIQPGDWQALALNISKLLSDETLRRQMGECAKRRVVTEFSFPLFENRLEQLVEECISA